MIFNQLFDEILKNAFIGINRALKFSKFAIAGNYNLEKINEYCNENEILRKDFSPPIKNQDFIEWIDKYIKFNNNNCLNEIIEYFNIFLEITAALIIETKDPKLIKTLGKFNLPDLINIKKNKNFNKIKKRKDLLKYLNDNKISFSEDELLIFNSFFEIRNLLTHNLGASGERPNLDIENECIKLSWYVLEGVALTNDNRELSLTDLPYMEKTRICLKNKRREKLIPLNAPLSFEVEEIQEFAWTFYRLIKSIEEKVKESEILNVYLTLE